MKPLSLAASILLSLTAPVVILAQSSTSAVIPETPIKLGVGFDL